MFENAYIMKLNIKRNYKIFPRALRDRNIARMIGGVPRSIVKFQRLLLFLLLPSISIIRSHLPSFVFLDNKEK